jgi:hypothetical protein
MDSSGKKSHWKVQSTLMLIAASLAFLLRSGPW